MARKPEESPLSLFSFQDIIMSVSGIITLVVLLLALKIVSSPLKGGGGDTMPPSEYQKKQEQLQELQNRIAEIEARRAALIDEITAQDGSDELDDVDDTMPEDPRAAIAALRAGIRQKKRDAALENQQRHDSERETRGLEEKNRELATRIQEVRDRDATTKRIHLIPEEETSQTIYVAICSGSKLSLYQYGSEERRREFFATEAGINQFLAQVRREVIGNACLILMIRPSAAEITPRLIGALRAVGVPFGHEPLAEDWVVAGRGGGQ